MDRNEVAYLSGGRRRVALAALFTLVEDGRLRLSYADKLYTVTGAESGDPVEEAALAQRSTIPEALAALAEHESVRAVEEDLIRRGLVGRGWLGLTRRPTPAGKKLTEHAMHEKRQPSLRVALHGVAGISDETLRRRFAVAKSKGSLRGQGTGGWDATRDYDGGSGGNPW
ncbi:TIGR04222 domain-containing membrane protein [Nonomuraea sp. FMUSA5-5]|uniref:TIGR04222 domain-containing membrane protein n=1 Tax=Nonomuraea composti TaxID=2720023 RepID=A0ABX1BLD9_9ACTN|nr:TIGR04222 domain-containing membrane protein [Nonomuraea sp. FMUSA5-5]